MDNTRRVLVAKAKEEQESHRLLSASSSGSRRRCSPTNSPEFEFWMVRNPSFPKPNLLSADQLFVNGVLLPLHLLQPNNNDNNNHPHQSDPPDPQLDTRSSLPDPRHEIPPAASVTAAEPTTSQTSSKRWTNIFRKSEKKAAAASNKNQEDNKDREKKMMKEKEEKKKKKMKKARVKKGGHTHSGGSSSAELNIIINLWPFSRSRSAGNGGSRPRMFAGAPGTRKSSSAPCSRSNSAGESKSRKWPSSPGRPGVHLCRSSPVWQARHSSSCGRSGGSTGYNIGKSNRFYQLMAQSGESWASKKEVTEPRRSKTGSRSNGHGSNNNNNNDDGGGGPINSKAKVLNMKVPAMCIGHRNHLRCGRDENGGLTGAAVGGSNRGVKNGNTYNLVNGGNGNIFNFFTKKVY